MSWLRNRQRPSEPAAWEGPFAPPAPTGHPRFHPMLRTAAQLTDHPDQVTGQIAGQIAATSEDPAATTAAPAAA